MQPEPPGDPGPTKTVGKNHALNLVIERNLRKMIYLRMKSQRERGLHERISDQITSFSGRMIFVYIHVVWFLAWILVNLGFFGIRPFDPFPFGLLTMIVSLEAIFLSTFVLISQNRMSQESEHRSDLVMHISILAEHELTLALQMLDAIQDKMGIETANKDELADLETEIKPEDVLAEIERLQGMMKRTG
jgi:uncharacterized membrane protein